jgi:hypothetical protein
VRPSSVEEARHELACESCGSLGLCDCGTEDPSGCEHCGERFDCACSACGTCEQLQSCAVCTDAIRTRLAAWYVGDVLDCAPSEHEARASARDLELRRSAARWGCAVAVARAARRAA